MKVKGAVAAVVGFTVLGMLYARFAGSQGAGASSEGRCTRTVRAGDDLLRAVGELPADGQPATVCLGAGEFRIGRFVPIERDGLTVRGSGASTVVRLDQGAPSPVILIGDYEHATPQRSVSDVTIENLRIVGGGAGGSEFLTDHPYVTNSAIVIRGARKVAIRNVEVTACRSACILTEFGSEEIAIEGNRVSGSVWDGISLNRTSKVSLVGNTIQGNTAAGITVEHLEDSVIQQNSINDNKTHGIYLSDSYRNTIAANGLSGNVLSGVFVTCAVHERAPARCWNDSMSRDNRFEWNELAANRVAYMVGADSAANCTKPDFAANLSCGDRFSQNAQEQADASYGQCLRYSDHCPS